MIQKISFQNFKLFRDKQTLEIRPMTILIGKNNTGKTAVVKLPTLIAGSLSKGAGHAPLKLENEGVRIGLSYEDLFYNRQITGDALAFEIESKTHKLEILIAGDLKYNIFIAKSTLNGKEIPVKKNKFNGFVPKNYPLEDLKLHFDYIDALRKFPDPQFSDIYTEVTKIGNTGENAYKLMVQYHQNSDPLLEDIKKWFKQNFEAWDIDVKTLSGSSPLFEIVLSTSILGAINIVNTGSGIRQSLPLIVRSFMPAEEETLIIIEEPETHLHPAAHGNLAERFVDSCLADPKKRYLIETHSENFILRIQRLVAENKLNIKDVIIYYVDYDEIESCSHLKALKIETDGEIEDWPDNIFNESLDEVLKLRQAQAKNHKK